MQDKNQNPEGVTPQNEIDPLTRPNVLRGVVSVKREGDLTNYTYVAHVVMCLNMAWNTNFQITKINIGGTDFQMSGFSPKETTTSPNGIYDIAYELSTPTQIFCVGDTTSDWKIYWNQGNCNTVPFTTFHFQF